MGHQMKGYSLEVQGLAPLFLFFSLRSRQLKNNNGSLPIKCATGPVKCMGTVDTGSNRTAIKPDMLQTLGNRGPKVNHLVSCKREKCTPQILGKMDLKTRPLEFKQEVWRADRVDELIIALGFIIVNNVLYDV